MFISRFIIDICSPSARQAIQNRQDMHRNIQRWFNSDRTSSDVLYRVVALKNSCLLYVYSSIKPSLTKEEGEKLGMTLEKTRDVGEPENLFRECNVYRFNIVTSPSKKIRVDGKKNSSRVFLCTSKERLNWLNRVSLRNGFSIISVDERELNDITISKSGDKTLIRTVMYDGILKIDDYSKFKMAFQNGIGPEKAYGLGMLLIRSL